MSTSTALVWVSAHGNHYVSGGAEGLVSRFEQQFPRSQVTVHSALPIIIIENTTELEITQMMMSIDPAQYGYTITRVKFGN